MGRFPGLGGGLDTLALSADPFLTLGDNLFGAVAQFVRPLIQIIHSFIGAAANVGIAPQLFEADRSWWLAGLNSAAIGAVWNYAMSSVFIWRSRTSAPARREQSSTAPIRAHPVALTYAHD